MLKGLASTEGVPLICIGIMKKGPEKMKRDVLGPGMRTI